MAPKLFFLGEGPNMNSLRAQLPQSSEEGGRDCAVLFEVQRAACPYELISLLGGLENKRLLLIAVTPLADSSDFHRQLESQILPFLPDSCQYLGLHLCPGEMEPESLFFFTSFLQKTGHSERLYRFHRAYAASRRHPDGQDAAALQSLLQQTFPAEICQK